MFGAFLTACNRILNSNQGKIPNGLIQYSPLTGTGTDFKADNDLVGTGSEWVQDNLKGSCLVQNQTTDYVDGISVVDIASTWSMSLWCKKENSNMVNQYVLSIGDNTTEYIMVSLGNTTSNRVIFEVKGNTTEFDNSYVTDIVPNRWYNIALTANNGVITLYLDGVQRYQLTTTFTANTPNITIGNHVTDRTKGMVGRYSQFRIFDSVLSSDDINNLHKRDLYNHPLVVDHDVIGVYPFYKDAKDNWFTQHELTTTGSVPFTDRAANFNNVSGNYLKTLLATPDIYAIYIEYIPTNDITNATAKQEIISFGSNLGVYCGSSDANATNETLLIMNGSNSTYITDTIDEDICQKILFNWNTTNSNYDIQVNKEVKTTTANTNGHAGLITGGDRIALSENNPIDGKIQNLRLWSVPLTNDEINSLGGVLTKVKFYWKLDGNAAESKGTGKDGTWDIGTEAYTSGHDSNQSADFNGSSRIRIPAGVADNKNYSYGCWFKTTYSSDWQGLVEFFDDYYIFLIVRNNGDVETQDGHNNLRTSGVAYNDGNWHHVMVTKNDVTDFKLYIDGELKLQALNSGVNVASNSNGKNTIGNYCSEGTEQKYFHGQIDNVVYFDFALSDSEIQELYNS